MAVAEAALRERLKAEPTDVAAIRMLAEVGAVHRRGGTLKEAFGAAHAALAERYGRWPIFEHCMPFNTSRLWDELSGIERPRIWTAQRDREVWAELPG